MRRSADSKCIRNDMGWEWIILETPCHHNRHFPTNTSGQTCTQGTEGRGGWPTRMERSGIEAYTRAMSRWEIPGTPSPLARGLSARASPRMSRCCRTSMSTAPLRAACWSSTAVRTVVMFAGARGLGAGCVEFMACRGHLCTCTEL